MTTILIATLLTATPGISLTNLSDAPHSELRLRDLDAGRPSLAGTIVLFSIGAPAFVGGLAVAGYGLSLLGLIGNVAGVGALFAGLAPYLLIGFAAIFGILPGAILLGSAVYAAVKRNANVTETREIATRLNAHAPEGMQTLMTF